MKTTEEIVRDLVPEKYAIFVSGDLGVTTMQEDLKNLKLQVLREGGIGQEEYRNLNGVFLRFSVKGVVHSGIIQTDNETETRGMLIDIPQKLHAEGANLLTILRLPLNRIPLFPFFSIVHSSLSTESIKELSLQYWVNLTDDVEALKNWYMDFIRMRREIINTEIPQLEPSVPSWLGNLKVYILYNDKDRVIATAYYRNSEKKDDVLVEKTSEPVGLRTEEAFSKVFSLPSKEDYLSRSISHSAVGERVFSQWDHPFFSAVKDLREQVERFNRLQPSVYYDAYALPTSHVYNWTYHEIIKMRELITRFPKLGESLQHWLRPVQVLIFYMIDEPIKGRVTDGIITAYYMNGPENKIIVERVENRDHVKWNEEIIHQYFPKSEKPIWGFQSSILTYLSGKLGADY